jgi:hypothetical protein
LGLAGRLEDLGISDIFQILGIGRKTGILAMTGRKGTALINFRDGCIVRAETSAFENTLADDLLKAGAVRESTLGLARAVQRTLPGKSLVEILHELDAVKKETIEKYARKRIEKVVCEVMQWSEGDFLFELEEDLPESGSRADIRDLGWRLQKGLSPEYLLMEGARVYDEASQGLMTEEEDVSAESVGEAGWDEDWTGGGTERKDIVSLKALTQELRFPNSTPEITLLVLRFASEIFQRGVLFMVGPGEMAGLGQFGLDIERADERVRQIMLDYRESPFLSGIIGEGRSYRGAVESDGLTDFLVRELGGARPSEVAIFPLVAEGSVVALLYCDNLGGEGMPQSEGLEIFISQAGLALEKALLQRRLRDIEKGK